MNTVFSSQITHSFGASAYFRNLFIGQSSIPVSASFWSAAFYHAIFVVIRSCSQLKMGWINAPRIVTNVHHYFPFRYATTKLFIRKSMSAHGLLSWHKHNAVSVSVPRSSPFPTSIISFFVSVAENIGWPNNRKFVKAIVPPHPIVVIPAQLSSDRWLAAQHARKRTACSIGHSILYAFTMEVAS